MMDPQRQEFEQLIATTLDGSADATQAERLRQLLKESPELRGEYTRQMTAHALLRWRSGEIATEAPPQVIRHRFWKMASLAAASVLFLSLAAWLPNLFDTSPRLVEIEIIESSPAGNATGHEGLIPGMKLAVSELRMPEGSFRFRLRSGAIIATTGPAHLTFLHSMHLRVKQGKVTADVGKEAKGFIIDTDQTRIVDIGTRFGVDASLSGHTDVVVFEGEVHLKDNPHVGRLIEGEAVRIDSSKSSSRIASITSGPAGDDEWSSTDEPSASAVITAVSDNLHNPCSNNYYRIIRGGMMEDARAFIAKRHEWNGLDDVGLPDFLIGADLVQTFPSGSQNAEIQLTATLSRAATVYVFVDSRLPAPAWLKEGFTDTGAHIGLENAPHADSGTAVSRGPGNGKLAPFSVWSREVRGPGTCTFGPPPDAAPSQPHWMYGIAAKPL